MPRLRTCPKCRALVPPSTKSCPYCSTSLLHLGALTESQEAARAQRLFAWILVVNFVIYGAMLVLAPSIDPEVVGLQAEPTYPVGRAFGCTLPRTFADFELWRLLAANYVHWSPLHLLVNCFVLFILGNLAARTFGGTRTWVIYVAAGLGGSCLSILFTGGAGAGASGAAMGLIGALLVYGRRRGGLMGRALAARMTMWIVIMVIWGATARLRTEGVDPIDNWGHGGGLVAGLLVGWLAARVTAPGGLEDRIWRRLAVFCTILVAVTAFFMAISVKGSLMY